MSAIRLRHAFHAMAGVLAACGVLGARDARADDTIKTPFDHLVYPVEVEPHVLVGWDNIYASGGLGVGARFAIPVVENGFVPSINNSVAITFGADLMHYEGCYDRPGSCNANYLYIPVALQWNFFVAKKWSVFGEPGLFVYKGFVDSCNGAPNCVEPNTFGVRPALYLGGRYHINNHMALTMRVGYPSFSAGLSFM